MKIKYAKRIALNIPFYSDHVDHAMARANTHNERVWIYQLETDNGLVSITDGHAPADTASLIGKDPWALIWNDDIGFGPQIAAFDLCGKEAGVPVHALLGKKLRDRCPISWWDIDMSPEDWVKEAKESIARGYTCFKMKARPWRDIVAQIDAVSEVVPTDYKFDVDFNGFLLTQAKAEQILSQLDQRINVGMYESPFYLRKDLKGAQLLRERIQKPIVEHFGEDVWHEEASDGFVIGGGASGTMRQGIMAGALNKPFWLQMVGSGPTTTFAAHIGSVLSHAQLPYITCHELWKTDLLKERIDVVDGYMPVPDKPGLGIEVDEKAIEKYTVEDDEPTSGEIYRSKTRILRVVWPGTNGQSRVWEFTDESIYQPEFYKGNLPGFESGVHLEIIEDDHSAAFAKKHGELACREAGVARAPMGI